jgi:hypothetical protein
MCIMFQVHLPTSKDITTPNTVRLCWTSFAPCGVVFSNCDASNRLTKARVSNSTQLTQRYKIKALYINPLNAELYSISHLLALLGAHPIRHVSRIRVMLLFSF